mgnify:CR=1 FL=1
MLENSLGIGKTMKKRKMLILAIASALIIGGTIVVVQNKDLFGGIDQQKYQNPLLNYYIFLINFQVHYME